MLGASSQFRFGQFRQLSPGFKMLKDVCKNP